MTDQEKKLIKQRINRLYAKSPFLNRENFIITCHLGYMDVICDMFKAIEHYCFRNYDPSEKWSIDKMKIVIQSISHQLENGAFVYGIDGILLTDDKNEHILNIEKIVNQFISVARRTCPICGKMVTKLSGLHQACFIPKISDLQYFCDIHYPQKNKKTVTTHNEEGLISAPQNTVEDTTPQENHDNNTFDDFIRIKNDILTIRNEMIMMHNVFDLKFTTIIKGNFKKHDESEQKNQLEAIEKTMDPNGVYIDFAADNDAHLDQLHQGLSKNEKQDYIKAVVKKIKQSGLRGKRQLIKIQNNYLDVLDEFERRFPNFIEFAQFLRSSLALADLADGVIHFKPVLLLGVMGIGKTTAAHWIAKNLQLPFEYFDASTFQGAFMLSGSESYWANSDTGIVFKTLAYKTIANPLLMIDEIDKAHNGLSNQTGFPLSPLLGLLENETAKNFQDLSMRDIPLDASFINWVFAANDEKSIDPVIKSRLEIIKIDEPTQEQNKIIAQNIYREFVQSKEAWDTFFDGELNDDVIQLFNTMSPRAMRKIITSSLGLAAQEKQHSVSMEHVKKAQALIDQRKPKMGF